MNAYDAILIIDYRNNRCSTLSFLCWDAICNFLGLEFLDCVVFGESPLRCSFLYVAYLISIRVCTFSSRCFSIGVGSGDGRRRADLIDKGGEIFFVDLFVFIRFSIIDYCLVRLFFSFPGWMTVSKLGYFVFFLWVAVNGKFVGLALNFLDVRF